MSNKEIVSEEDIDRTINLARKLEMVITIIKGEDNLLKEDEIITALFYTTAHNLLKSKVSLECAVKELTRFYTVTR